MTSQSSVVAIGVFDGLHLGHQALTAQTASVAAEFGLLPRALTFNPHPMTVVRGMQVELLVSIERRIELLREAGMHDVYVCNFDSERASQSPEEFIASVLIEKLGAQHVVVGKGFRFGKGAAGNADTLREAGLVVHEVAQVNEHGGRVSSTRIRELIAGDDLETANELLTRPHRVEGVVVHGKKRGRDLGFPTANLRLDFRQAIAADGVYAGWLSVVGECDLEDCDLPVRQWPAAISVGTNPTFDDVPERVVEAYALHETDIDLYDHLVAVDFVAKVRDMRAFSSLLELISAMNADVAASERILGLS
ncbi:MAG: hypothetical protein RL441_1647 [Actinomycetota bacterium]